MSTCLLLSVSKHLNLLQSFKADVNSSNLDGSAQTVSPTDIGRVFIVT